MISQLALICLGYPSVPNGIYYFPGERSVGTKISFDCNSGYHLDGLAYTECQSNGKWKAFGTCNNKPNSNVPISECLDVPTVPNGNVFHSGENSVGTRFPIVCYPEFQMKGLSFVECQSDGKWHALGSCHGTSRCTWPKEVAQDLLVYFDRTHSYEPVASSVRFRNNAVFVHRPNLVSFPNFFVFHCC